ncbi:MAG: dethiobiotin synthase [Planctomyces sp.]|nr:dethiobiotin synthase [Planctomyces sp.]
MKTLIVTGTDTGVGKTWISTLLIRGFHRQGYQTGAYKPVCSGAEFRTGENEPFWEDADRLRAACSGSPPPSLVCPQRFIAPLAPPEAARCEGRTVDAEQLKSGLEAWRGQAEIVVVEGAGGFLSPLTDNQTLASLAVDWQAPIFVVAANRLGVVNHTLLTIEAIRYRKLKVAGIVLNDVSPDNSGSDGKPVDLSRRSNLSQLQRWLPDISIFTCDWKGEVLKNCSTGQENEPVQMLTDVLYSDELP